VAGHGDGKNCDCGRAMSCAMSNERERGTTIQKIIEVASRGGPAALK
jgi:hypothetical protein